MKLPLEYDLYSYDYDLPKELIAYFPPKNRSESKLLGIDRQSSKLYFHDTFRDIVKYLREGDLLVLNDTKVFPARLKLKKKTGAELDVLLFQKPKGLVFETKALIKGKRLKEGQILFSPVEPALKIEILQKLGDGAFLIRLTSEGSDLGEIINRIGLAPLPPYIKREPQEIDLERYQTVYANKEGSIAAPTAGFHFTKDLIEDLKQKGIRFQFITLHVGYGTFAPIKTRDIRLHRIEPEYIEVREETITEIERTIKEKGRVIAVGTTVVRALEFIAQKGFTPYEGLCDLYIYPGFNFKVISGLITNFHLPKSSLLLLVCAFAGRELILKAYQEAIKRGYRFYSYGDATIII